MLTVNFCRPHDRRRALTLVRGAQVHISATPGRHRATGRRVDALRDDPERGGRHPRGAAQAHRALRRIEHVPRLEKK
jgi:hypothetical protein